MIANQPFHQIVRLFALSAILLGGVQWLSAQETQTVGGILEAGDLTHESGGLYDVHEVTLSAGQELQAAVSTKDFPPMMILRNVSGETELTSNGVAGETPISLSLRGGAALAGDYQILVISRAADRAGGYNLTVSGATLKESMESKPLAGGVGWTENRLELSDDGYAGNEYRNDVYVIPLTTGDTLGVTVATEAFVPEIMSGWSRFSMNGVREDGYGAAPDTEATITLENASQAGNYYVSVLSEEPFVDGDNYNYSIRFTLNGFPLQGPEGITAEGGEGSGDVQVDTSKVAGGAMEGEGAPANSGSEMQTAATEHQTEDGEDFSVSADAWVDRHSFASAYSARAPERAIGPPDGEFSYTGRDGSGLWEFVDNELVDGPGPDLAVFTLGADTADDPFSLQVSRDGRDFVTLGKGSGKLTRFDLSDRAPGSEPWRFVKITDLSGEPDNYPGTRVDAIGAINSSSFEPEIPDLITEGNLIDSLLGWKADAAIDATDQVGRNGLPTDFWRIQFSEEELSQFETLRISLQGRELGNGLSPTLVLLSDWDGDELGSNFPVTRNGTFSSIQFSKNSLIRPLYLGVMPTLNEGSQTGVYTLDVMTFDAEGKMVRRGEATTMSEGSAATGIANIRLTELKIEDSPTGRFETDFLRISGKVWAGGSPGRFTFPQTLAYGYQSNSGAEWRALWVSEAVNTGGMPPERKAAPMIPVGALEEGEIAWVFLDVKANGFRRGAALDAASFPASSSWQPTKKIGLPAWDNSLVASTKTTTGGSQLILGSDDNHQIGLILALARVGNQIEAVCFGLDGILEGRTDRDFTFPTRIRNTAGNYDARLTERSIPAGQKATISVKGEGVTTGVRTKRTSSDVRLTFEIENLLR